MKIITAKTDCACEKRIALDDMILTSDMPTAAGSRMLDGYMSLFDAEVVTRLKEAGHCVSMKADVGEFAVDLMGETSYNGAPVASGVLVNAACETVKNGDAVAAISLDVNGAIRRGAAQSGLVCIKPTYGTVSRYGTIPAACSGECVSVTAGDVKTVADILSVIAGHDDKDGTSLPAEKCEAAGKVTAPVKRIGVIRALCEGVDADVQAKLDEFCAKAQAAGIEIVTFDGAALTAARAAWNVLMSAEVCNNVSRYDGVKYGYRAERFTNIDELYTNSRTEAFGDVLKSVILYGSETLSTENYMKVYDKSLRVRRIICEIFADLFEDADAVLMPAVGKMAYTEEDVKADKYMAFSENVYTAPASITGLPAVVAGGVQLVGPALSDAALLDAVARIG
ncbi:MAG: hypothetical protein IJO81_05920 [Clostridia bacterium]|nr:hypothetical protein [Clostridia bacterium]